MGWLLSRDRNQYAFLGLVLGMLLVSMSLVYFRLVIVKMLPFDSKSEFQVIIDTPEGTSLEKTAAAARALGAKLSEVREITDYQTYVGTASPYNFNGLVRHYYMRRGENVADIQVNLTGKGDRSEQSHAIARRVRVLLEPLAKQYGVRMKVSEVPPGPPVLQTLVAEVYGPDYTRQIELAREIRDTLEHTPGVVDVDWYVEDPQPELRFHVDRLKASLAGVSVGEIQQSVEMGLKGAGAGLLHVPKEVTLVEAVARFEIKGLDIGDVDGDKKNELIMMDRHNLYIFNYDGERLKLVLKVEQGSEHNFLTLDVADVNRNGVAEIIVTSVVEDNLQSFILEYEQGAFKKVVEGSNWYFRVLEHPKEGPLLMGQRMGSEGLFSGPIYQLVWKKNSFERGIKFDFPKETKIYGLTVADIRNQGVADVIILEDSERMAIFSKDGKFSWRSRFLFGGTNNYYDTTKKKDPADKLGLGPTWRVYIPGRMLIRDLDGDGLQEIIVPKNLRSSRMLDRARGYDTGEIYSLIWQEGSLDIYWKTREINGYISDFQIKDVDNDGTEELVVSVVDTGGTTNQKGTSNILFFKLF